MEDGTLNIAFDANGPDGVDQPKISAIEILGQTANAAPTAVAVATPLSGTAPLEVSFDASGSFDAEGDLTYVWDFGNGDSSTEEDPVYVYETPGSFTATLTVTDEGELIDSDVVTINVEEPVVGDFALRINAGGPALSFEGNDYVADVNFVGGKAFGNPAAEVATMYQTERSASPPAFEYAVPLADGEYSITLHFAEIYWGATGGGTGGTGQRIFDVAIEGATVLDDFDINAIAGPQTAITRTFNVTMEDGTLNIAFDANGPDGVDQPKISAIEILGQTANAAPTAVAVEANSLAAKTIKTLSLSPNPASSEIVIALTGLKEAAPISDIYVYDVIGRLVQTIPASEVDSQGSYRMDVSTLQNGIYFVRTFDQYGVPHQKQMAIKH